MSKVTFITGNANKAQLLEKLLGIEIEYHKLDLDEIQSKSPEEIVEHKVRQAYGLLKSPVLVEDTSFGFDALGGLPGPFIKFFIGLEDGAEKICRMLDGLESRRATATVIFGYYDGEELKLFKRTAGGEVPLHPGRQLNGFGWDVVFIPDGHNGVIRSELNDSEYNKSYLEAKPIDEVREFLKSI